MVFAQSLKNTKLYSSEQHNSVFIKQVVSYTVFQLHRLNYSILSAKTDHSNIAIESKITKTVHE